MKAHLRLFRELFTANVAAAVEYRGPFVVQLVGMMLNNASFLVFWTVFLGQVGTLGGWGLTDVMFLWALGPATFGLAHVVAGNVRQLGRMIVDGDLDVYLLQPKDPLLHVLVSRTDVSAWGDLAGGASRAWPGRPPSSCCRSPSTPRRCSHAKCAGCSTVWFPRGFWPSCL